MSRSAIVRGRPEQDAPVQLQGEVVSRSHHGRYWSLSFVAKEIAERARPGQFVEVAVSAPGTLLRRPFSIAGVSRQGLGAGTVEIVFDAHGPGTRWLTELDVHDVVDVIGPLGTSFPLPQRKVPCLLIGGGYGTAPLFYLGEQLVRQGLRVDMIVGASTQERLLSTIDAKRLSASVTFTTDDGSYGTQGKVTDVLDDVIAASRTGVVYACGPNPMLAAVSARCRELELPVQVAVEERMACGVGVCFTCVLPVHDRDGIVHNRRSCLEGPVFDGARVAWDASRYAAAPPPAAGDTVAASPPHAADRPTATELWGSR